MRPEPGDRPTTRYLLNLPQTINARRIPDDILTNACSDVITATRIARSSSFNPSMINPLGQGNGIGNRMRNLIGSKRGKEGLFGVNELHNPYGYLSDDDKDERAGTPTGTYCTCIRAIWVILACSFQNVTFITWIVFFLIFFFLSFLFTIFIFFFDSPVVQTIDTLLFFSLLKRFDLLFFYLNFSLFTLIVTIFFFIHFQLVIIILLIFFFIITTSHYLLLSVCYFFFFIFISFFLLFIYFFIYLFIYFFQACVTCKVVLVHGDRIKRKKLCLLPIVTIIVIHHLLSHVLIMFIKTVIILNEIIKLKKNIFKIVSTIGILKILKQKKTD